MLAAGLNGVREAHDMVKFRFSSYVNHGKLEGVDRNRLTFVDTSSKNVFELQFVMRNGRAYGGLKVIGCCKRR